MNLKKVQLMQIGVESQLRIQLFVKTDYGSFDVNNPKSALDVMVPDVSEKLDNIEILEIPLVDASRILDLPLYKWHSLFDNTAIIPGAAEYKYTGKNVNNALFNG